MKTFAGYDLAEIANEKPVKQRVTTHYPAYWIFTVQTSTRSVTLGGHYFETQKETFERIEETHVMFSRKLENNILLDLERFGLVPGQKYKVLCVDYGENRQRMGI